MQNLGGSVMPGVEMPVLTIAGAPGAGTSEVQTLTIDATGGTFRLSFDGCVTGDIAWSATNTTLVANIKTALEALPNIGTGGVTVAVGTMTAGVGTITLTFAAQLGKLAVNTIFVNTNALTGTKTLTVAKTTAGVTADGRGRPKGALYVDTTGGKLYINTGTAIAPTWTVVGTQT